MKYIGGLDISLPDFTALTVGKFESIHLGHQMLIDEVLKSARGYNIPSAVVTFRPHPRSVLQDAAYKPMFTPAERERILRRLGVDYLLEYPFDDEFAALSAWDFCDMLFNALRAKVLVVGEGYRFGKSRAGTADTLREAAKRYRAEVTVLPRRGEKDKKISTSEIRMLIGRGAMEDAASLLGFPFFMSGTVRHGRQLGRTLGFPTANLLPGPEKFLPPDGVYVTRTHCGERTFASVTNVGLRPTVNSEGAEDRTAETFLFDFDGDLYGKDLLTAFLSFLRPERRFKSTLALREQAAFDMKLAKEKYGALNHEFTGVNLGS